MYIYNLYTDYIICFATCNNMLYYFRPQDICCYIPLPTYNTNFEALVFHIYLLPLSAYILFNSFQMRNVHFTDFNYLKSFFPY